MHGCLLRSAHLYFAWLFVILTTKESFVDVRFFAVRSILEYMAGHLVYQVLPIGLLIISTASKQTGFHRVFATPGEEDCLRQCRRLQELWDQLRKKNVRAMASNLR